MRTLAETSEASVRLEGENEVISISTSPENKLAVSMVRDGDGKEEMLIRVPSGVKIEFAGEQFGLKTYRVSSPEIQRDEDERSVGNLKGD